MEDLEAAARDNLARVIESEPDPDELVLTADMAETYGLTSMNKILFLMSLCEETGVDLSVFTEPDVAAMDTLEHVIAAFSKHVPTAA